MANWKTFKITTTLHQSSDSTFYLDNYVSYRCGNYDRINCSYTSPFKDWGTGDYIEIDLDKIKYKSFGERISDVSIVRKISSSNEIVSRSNNNLTSISQSQASGAIQMLNRAIDSDPRNKYTASVEVNPKTGNVFYHLSGERK